MTTIKQICIIVFVGVIPLGSSQIYPGSYEVGSNVISENGSSETGHCSNVADSGRVCNSPRSSVLFDGIPTLTELDGDIWARQLLTFNTSTSPANITFNFTNTSDRNGPTNYTGVQTIEVVVFNCPKRGIRTSDITILDTDKAMLQNTVRSTASISCDYLIRICIDIITTSTIITVSFINMHQRIYIAEVKLYSNPNRCSMAGPILSSVITTSTTVSDNRIISSNDGSFFAEMTSTTYTSTNISTDSPSSTVDLSSNSATTIAVVMVVISLIIVLIIVIIIIMVVIFRRHGSKVQTDSSAIKKDQTPDKLDENPKESFQTAANDEPHYSKLDHRMGIEQSSRSVDATDHTYSTVEPTVTYEDMDKFDDKSTTLSKETTFNYRTAGTYEEMNIRKIISPTSHTIIPPEYEEIEVQTSNNSKSVKAVTTKTPACDKGKTATNNAHSNKQNHNTGIEQISKAPSDVSDHTYFTLEPTDNWKIRRFDASDAAVNKLSPKPVHHDILDKKCDERENDPPSDLEKRLPDRRSVTSTDNSPPKPVHHDTKSKPHEGFEESTSPVISKKSLDSPHSEPDHKLKHPSLKRPPVDVYEFVFNEALQPSLFKQNLEESKSSVCADDFCPCSSIFEVPSVPLPLAKPLQVSAKNIKVQKQLGSGQFGTVVLAKTVGLSPADFIIGESTNKKKSILVLVKMLKASASESSKKKFEKEYQFMFRLNHCNVMRLLGICTEGTPFIMMEYMENGNLNEVLKHQYSTIIDSSLSTIIDSSLVPGDGEITKKTLIHICNQIAGGMNYLATKNFIHRDIATRNCLVGKDFLIKIADFGMSQSLYDSHYYIVNDQAKVPIRWMASECFYGKFSAKSDVWAFGCTMWEVFELCQHMPYYEMKHQEMIDNALLGAERTILPCPSQCPESVYEVMLRCWSHEAKQRATFEELFKKLSALDI